MGKRGNEAGGYGNILTKQDAQQLYNKALSKMKEADTINRIHNEGGGGYETVADTKEIFSKIEKSGFVPYGKTGKVYDMQDYEKMKKVWNDEVRKQGKSANLAKLENATGLSMSLLSHLKYNLDKK